MDNHGRYRVAAALLAVFAAMTVLVAVDVTSPPILFRMDTWWRDLVQPSAEWLHDLARAMYFVGLGWVMIPLRLAVGLWLATRRRWVDLVVWLGAWAVADLVTGVLKAGVGRMRPDLSDTKSFPSGHAKSAAQVSVGLVLLLIPSWRSRRAGWIACGAWVAAMSISRTILDEHWASDVIAGSLIGAGVMLLFVAAAPRLGDRGGVQPR